MCADCGQPYGGPNNEHVYNDSWNTFDSEQHFRLCSVCWLNATQQLAPHADDNTDGYCDGCGYDMPLPCQHTNMSDWFYDSAEWHYRACADCWAEESYEYAAHAGGEATCIEGAQCVDCCEYYGELSDVHGEMSEWQGFDDERHFQYCLVCGRPESYTYAPHTGGTATCIECAQCEGCGWSYGELSNVHGEMSEWAPANDEQHFQYCNDCASLDSYNYAPHSGGTASCILAAECDVCGRRYGEPDANAHTYSDWVAVANNQHYRHCQLCFSSDTDQYADHVDADNDGVCVRKPLAPLIRFAPARAAA